MSPGVPNMSMTHMSDEEYLVFRAKTAKQRDEFEAKAWLITAGTLFPQNFMIQFEAYLMHKQSGNVTEAACHLDVMFGAFPTEDKLWQELRCLLDCLQAETLEAGNKFLKDVYFTLPMEVQRLMLLTAAERTNDTVEHSKLILMLLRMFPECTAHQGLKLVDTILIAEKQKNDNMPVNCLRKLLVCDVLPVVLHVPTVDISHSVLYRLLHKSIEFCVYSVIKPYNYTDQGSQGLWDKNSTTETPWQNLAVIMEVIGQKFGWDLCHMFKSNDYESQWHALQSSCRQLQMSLVDHSSPHYLQLFYCAMVLFLRALCEYTLLVDPNQSSIGASEGSKNCVLILVEGLCSYLGQSTDTRCIINDYFRLGRMKAKKQKMDADEMPELSVSSKLTVAPSILKHCFYTAARCWDLLHATERIANDFSNLSNQLGIDALFTFQSFQTDMLIYKGLHKEALQWLSTLVTPAYPGYQEKLTLQAACCFYQLGEYVTACSKTMDVVCHIAETQAKCADDVTSAMTQIVKPARHLIFLSNTMTDMLHFCVKMLISRLREIVLNPNLCNEMALGHLLVLLQYDLLQEENLFLEIINEIKRNGGLTYSNFFSYIINIDILEEFAHLSSSAGGNLTFHLLPNSSQPGKSRTVTRGVNKGAKEDLRSALEKQVARSEEPLQPILVQFLVDERNTLFQNLTHYTNVI